MTDVWVVLAQTGDDPKAPLADIVGVFSSERAAKDAITTEVPRSGAAQRYVLDTVHGKG